MARLQLRSPPGMAGTPFRRRAVVPSRLAETISARLVAAEMFRQLTYQAEQNESRCPLANEQGILITSPSLQQKREKDRATSCPQECIGREFRRLPFNQALRSTNRPAFM